jgi:hypothetical protein
LAVPSIIFLALLNFVVFRSGSFIFAISSISASVIDATFTLFGSPEPDLIFAASHNSTEVGEVLSINEKLRSA